MGRFKKLLFQAISPVPLLGLMPDGAPLAEGLEWLEGNCREEPLSETVIKRYHRLILRATPDMAGQYRSHPLKMRDNAHKPPPPNRIAGLMKQLDARLTGLQSTFDSSPQVEQQSILEAAVDIYHRLGVIHPFVDGNGRAARFAMNHLMRRYKMGYVILPPLGESDELWKSLLAAGEGKKDGLLRMALQCIQKL